MATSSLPLLTSNSQFHKFGYYDKDTIFLNAGAPGTELLRLLPPLVEQATSFKMKKELAGEASLFQYGVETGNWEFRKNLSDYLTSEYGHTVSSEDIMLTGGASSGLWMIFSWLCNPGMTIFVEDPTYFIACQILQDLHLNAIPIKTDDCGICLDDLESKLKSSSTKIRQCQSSECDDLPGSIIYVIPIHHNPTGRSLSPDRCHMLVKIARKYNALIVCDDVYSLLSYYGQQTAPRTLFSYDNRTDPDYKGSVISNGSFSKILGPGLRIGWMEAPEWVIKKMLTVGVLRSGGGLNTYTAGLISSMLELGIFQEHVKAVRLIYKSNMETVIRVLEKELPPFCSLTYEPQGGYFLWIKLRERVNATQLLTFAKTEYNVSFTPGEKCSPTGSYKNFLRLGISFYPKEVLITGVKRLCDAITAFQEKLLHDS